MKRPQMTEMERMQQTISTFGGYCRKPIVAPNQFADMQNMTADAYPALAPRKRRGVVVPDREEEPEVLHGRETLWSLRTDQYGVTRLYKNDKVINQQGTDGQGLEHTCAPLARKITASVNTYTEGVDGEAAAEHLCVICPMLGDLDGNGRVTAADALLVTQIMSGKVIPTPEQVRAADINGNGRVDTHDWLLSIQLMDEKIKLPVPKNDEFFDITLGGGSFKKNDTAVHIVYNGVMYAAQDADGNSLTFADLPERALYQFQKEENKPGVFVIQEGKGDLRRTMVSMGSYIVIFPDKVAYNTLFSEDTATAAQLEGQQPWTNLENTFPTSGAAKATLTPCRLSDKGVADMEQYTQSDREPESPAHGDYWLDTTNTVLKQYDDASGEWVSVSTAYVKINASNIGKGFQKYDGVRLETDAPGLSGDTVIEDVGTDYIVVPGILQRAETDSNETQSNVTQSNETVTYDVTVTRTVPDMDFVVELDNRLWGCSSDKHEIYASKLGDPTNWNCYRGLSTDSYAATVGTPGVFTGAATLGGYVLFFKENVIHRVYGSKPANFQITTLNVPGIQEGSHASAAVVNEVLYYKGVRGIYATTGATPTLMSEDLGNTLYADAVGGEWDGRYVVSMRVAEETKDSGWHLFVYDPRVGLWHRQDNTHMLSCASVGEELYYAEQTGLTSPEKEGDVVNGTYIVGSMGGSLGYAPRTIAAADSKTEEAVEWFVETGDIEDTTPENMTVAQVRLRMAIEPKSRVRVFLRYDDDALWQEVWASSSASRRVMTLPLIPRRCNRFRMRIEGVGDCRLYSWTTIMEQGSELRGFL